MNPSPSDKRSFAAHDARLVPVRDVCILGLRTESDRAVVQRNLNPRGVQCVFIQAQMQGDG